MSFFRSMNISSSALAAQRVRMNVLSSNLANAQSTKGGPDGGVYRRQDVIFEAKPDSAAFTDHLDPHNPNAQLRKVDVKGIHTDTKEPRLVFDPHHPDANDKGYVALPNIDVMTEMVNMITATRAYEANTTAMNSAKQMAMRAIDIGR